VPATGQAATGCRTPARIHGAEAAQAARGGARSFRFGAILRPSFRRSPPGACATEVIRRERLGNGLTLLTESMPAVRSVAVGVWLRRGSRDEPARHNGISHFIEHLVFKGTQTRSARDIALAMDSIGGQVDAFTSREYTCFYAKVLDRHVDEAIELLADIVQRPRLDPQEIERERQVVLEEIRMIDDTPDDLIYDLFSSSFYPGQALGRPIQGTAASVGALGRQRLLGFFRRVYRPRNLVIAAAGHLDPGSFARKVRRAFGGLRGAAAPVPRRRPRVHRGQVRRRRDELEQLHLLLGLPTGPEGAPERYALHVLNTLLGGSMSSRLFQKIREERGLAYSVFSGVSGYRDAGHLSIYAATRPEAGAEVVRLALGELRALRERGPGEDELGTAKEHLKGSMMLALESTTSRMSNLARQEIYLGRQVGLAESLDRVSAVTARQVRTLARRLFDGTPLALAAVGRVGRLRLAAEALRP